MKRAEVREITIYYCDCCGMHLGEGTRQPQGFRLINESQPPDTEWHFCKTGCLFQWMHQRGWTEHTA